MITTPLESIHLIMKFVGKTCSKICEKCETFLPYNYGIILDAYMAPMYVAIWIIII